MCTSSATPPPPGSASCWRTHPSSRGRLVVARALVVAVVGTADEAEQVEDDLDVGENVVVRQQAAVVVQDEGRAVSAVPALLAVSTVLVTARGALAVAGTGRGTAKKHHADRHEPGCE